MCSPRTPPTSRSPRCSWSLDAAARASVSSGARWTGWRPTHLLGTRVHGRSLGIIGMGRIGRAVARRARAGFGMTVLYHDHRRRFEAERDTGAEWCESVDEVLGRSDFVSLHAPSTPETRGLIDATRLGLMRQGAFLINTARGDLVDETVIAEARFAPAAWPARRSTSTRTSRRSTRDYSRSRTWCSSRTLAAPRSSLERRWECASWRTSSRGESREASWIRCTPRTEAQRRKRPGESNHSPGRSHGRR